LQLKKENISILDEDVMIDENEYLQYTPVFVGDKEIPIDEMQIVVDENDIYIDEELIRKHYDQDEVKKKNTQILPVEEEVKEVEEEEEEEEEEEVMIDEIALKQEVERENVFKSYLDPNSNMEVEFQVDEEVIKKQLANKYHKEEEKIRYEKVCNLLEVLENQEEKLVQTIQTIKSANSNDLSFNIQSFQQDQNSKLQVEQQSQLKVDFNSSPDDEFVVHHLSNMILQTDQLKLNLKQVNQFLSSKDQLCNQMISTIHEKEFDVQTSTNAKDLIKSITS